MRKNSVVVRGCVCGWLGLMRFGDGMRHSGQEVVSVGKEGGCEGVRFCCDVM